MNLEEKRRAVIQWQTSGMIHPLTCRVNSRHKLLVAYEENEDVVGLKCLTCGCLQLPVPKFVFDALDQHRTWSEICPTK